jgi:hypothetical protein
MISYIKSKSRIVLKIVIFAIDEIAKRNYNIFNTLLQRRTFMSILVNISEELQKGKAKVVSQLVAEALESGIDPNDIPPESSFDNIDTFFKSNDEFYK